MASSEEVLFRRGSGNDDDEAWDDTALIKAYDKAVGMIKANIAKRNQSTNNVVEGSESDTQGKKSKKNKNNRTNLVTEWKVGNLCQAVYSEDGLNYPATIIKLNPNGQTCTVEYLGYGNREEVNLKELSPLKKKSYKKHSKHMSEDSTEVNGENCDMDFSDGVDNASTTTTSQGEHGEVRCSMHSRLNNPFCPLPSPPPPSFPSFMMPPLGPPWPGRGFPTLCHHSMPWNAPGVAGIPPPPPPPPVIPESPDEALASTLMAWYMTGYHTGYYQALRQFNFNPTSRKPATNKSKTKKKSS